ncbi:cell wall-active antibiotics response protein LiaF [Planococcus shenhongbingii]|uniref:Cell wall-active antibiotics response protein LiaF n=1 Tax=Planococcus shenhongbingii TaxID=3058398 RepID=A0ABT8NBG0_9BACL|nr:cell wall-active antibiotics response protein LiaF [Planococcus sp. N017]MDN7244880.1 cell wall-active antibiotics response protein LiaF [Planococcus sp. N017]
MQQFTTNKQALIILSALLLIFVEAAFFGNGSVFLVLLGIGLIYYAINKSAKTRKSYIWTGIILIGISVLSMWSLRLLIFSIAVYLLIRLWKGEEWQQSVPIQGAVDKGLIQNKFLSAQSTPIEAYEWKDIHVQGFVGDLLVDATQTVLPKKTSLISIRQGFGKVKIVLPYEIPVRIYYTTLLGDAQFFSGEKKRIWNGTIHAEDGYSQDDYNKTELVISLSTWMGDVEVIRR